MTVVVVVLVTIDNSVRDERGSKHAILSDSAGMGVISVPIKNPLKHYTVGLVDRSKLLV